MIIPNIWENIFDVPNHQPANYLSPRIHWTLIYLHMLASLRLSEVILAISVGPSVNVVPLKIMKLWPFGQNLAAEILWIHTFVFFSIFESCYKTVRWNGLKEKDSYEL